jgi:hypothetical protein
MEAIYSSETSGFPKIIRYYSPEDHMKLVS